MRSVGDIRSPFCCLGMKPPLNYFIFFFILSFFFKFFLAVSRVVSGVLVSDFSGFLLLTEFENEL